MHAGSRNEPASSTMKLPRLLCDHVVLIFAAVATAAPVAFAGSMHCLVVRPGYGLVSEKCPPKTVACRIKISHDAVEYYEYSALYDRNQFACVMKNEFGTMDKSGCVKNHRGRVRCWCYGRSNCNTPEDSKKLYEAFTSGDKRRLKTVVEEIDFADVEDDYEENPAVSSEPTIGPRTTAKSTEEMVAMRRLPKPSTTERSQEVVEKDHGEKIYKMPIVSRTDGGSDKPHVHGPKSNLLPDTFAKKIAVDSSRGTATSVAKFASSEKTHGVGRHHRLRNPGKLEETGGDLFTSTKSPVKKLDKADLAVRLPTGPPPSQSSEESSKETLNPLHLGDVVLTKKIQRGAVLGGEDEGVQVVHVNAKDKYYVSQNGEKKPSEARVLPTNVPTEFHDNLAEDDNDDEEEVSDDDRVVATTSRQDAYLESSFLSGRSKVDVVQIQPRDQELEEYFDNAFYAASNASGSILGLAGAIGSVSLLVVIAQIVL